MLVDYIRYKYSEIFHVVRRAMQRPKLKENTVN